MKNFTFLIMAVGVVLSTSCTVSKGCPSNGKNVGAERLLSADAKTMKLVKRAGKFKD